MSTTRNSRISRLQQARRAAARRLAAFGAIGVVGVAAVAVVTTAAVFQGPDRALAAMEILPDGAFGMVATAPVAHRVFGDEMIDAQPPVSTLQSRPVKKAAAPLPWQSAFCSTYGIGDGLLGSGLAGGGHLQFDSLVVAHKTLPFGTKVKFSYHGRTCTAVVKDRGPYVQGRSFDLGPGVARALGFGGIGRVKYQLVRG